MKPLAAGLALSWVVLPLLTRAHPPAPAGTGPPPTDWAALVKSTTFSRYVAAPGYSEGPSWRNGELYFSCNLGLLRVDKGAVLKYLDLKPAGTLARRDGSLIVCDNSTPALLLVTPEGKVGVIAEQYQDKKLGSLNDVTADRAGNLYWTDPKDSSPQNPVGKIFRVTPDGRVDEIAGDLAFPNGLEVDPENRYLYVIESRTAKVLRYEVPPAAKPLGRPTVFFALGGSGGDGCAFDKEGNLWVADYHRPETGKGRITILKPQGDQAKVLGHLEVPAQHVTNITFGGAKNDEVFVTTQNPPGVFHAKVGVAGFAGHAGKPAKVQRWLDLKVLNTPVKEGSRE